MNVLDFFTFHAMKLTSGPNSGLLWKSNLTVTTLLLSISTSVKQNGGNVAITFLKIVPTTRNRRQRKGAVIALYNTRRVGMMTMKRMNLTRNSIRTNGYFKYTLNSYYKHTLNG